jgi:hypothetical protein
MALGQQQSDHDHQKEREGGENDEDPRPADGGRDQAADRGSKQRRHAQHQHQQRQYLGALARREEIPDHGDGADLRDTAAKRLQQSKGDEQFRRAHGDAAEGRNGEQAQARIERPLASEAIEQRTVEQLPEREPNEIPRDRERDLRRRRAEIVRDLRKRRQIHVDGERADGAQRSENENDQQIRATATWHCKFQSDDFRAGAEAG